jgi:hypothetical protein
METATHYLPSSDGGISLYYRRTEGFWNTGEKYSGLEYYSSFGSWQGTNVRDIEEFISESLVEIPNTKTFWQGPTVFIPSWVQSPFRKLVSSKSKKNFEKYKTDLKQKGIVFSEGMDEPLHPKDYLLAVHEDDYSRAMIVLYPNRLIHNPKVIKSDILS